MELKLDQWATTPPVGYPGTVSPPPGKRSAGFTNGEEPPAGYFNHAWDALADTQNELANLITGAGLTRSESDLTQVLAAIKRLSIVRTELAGITQWVDLDTTGAGKGGNAIAASSHEDAVVVGASGAIRWHDGETTWKSRSATASFTGALFDVCWSSAFDRFVAVGSSGEIQDSPTGDVWTRRNTGGADWFACAAGAAAVVAVGMNGIMNTTNGTSWIARTSAFPGSVYISAGVAYSPSLNRFCVVGLDSGTYETKIQCSNDAGATWVAATAPLPASEGIIWSADHGLFFAWNDNEVFKSPDGMVWNAATGPVLFATFGGIQSVVALPAHLVLFGERWPQHAKLYRVEELDGTPGTVVEQSIFRPGGDGFTGALSRVIRIRPDAGNAFAGRLLGVMTQRISASHYLG